MPGASGSRGREIPRVKEDVQFSDILTKRFLIAKFWSFFFSNPTLTLLLCVWGHPHGLISLSLICDWNGCRKTCASRPGSFIRPGYFFVVPTLVMRLFSFITANCPQNVRECSRNRFWGLDYKYWVTGNMRDIYIWILVDGLFATRFWNFWIFGNGKSIIEAIPPSPIQFPHPYLTHTTFPFSGHFALVSSLDICFEFQHLRNLISLYNCTKVMYYNLQCCWII